MDEFVTYLIELYKVMQAGEMALFPEPDPPGDLGSPLTQAEIDFVKKLKKEMDERFLTPP